MTAGTTASPLPVTQALPLTHALLLPQDVTATRADFYLALPLRPDAQPSRGSSPTPGGGGGGPDPAGGASGGGGLRRRRLAGNSKRLEAEDCEVQVVFPRLRPRLSLLRQVYQQLSPLLATDLEALRAGAAGQPAAAQAAPGQQQMAAAAQAEPAESEQSQQIEEQRRRLR